MCILITDNGRVEQRLIDFSRDLSDDELSHLRSTFNGLLSGSLLTDIPSQLKEVSSRLTPELAVSADAIAESVMESVDANKQQKLVMAGTANLARTETDFHGNLYPVLDAIEEQVIILKLLTEMRAENDEVAISIGHEHKDSGLLDASVLATGYSAQGESASLGLLGPTRMDYSSNIASVRAVARYLTRILDTH
jgi:heat-inducible transcriptional repressor